MLVSRSRRFRYSDPLVLFIFYPPHLLSPTRTPLTIDGKPLHALFPLFIYWPMICPSSYVGSAVGWVEDGGHRHVRVVFWSSIFTAYFGYDWFWQNLLFGASAPQIFNRRWEIFIGRWCFNFFLCSIYPTCY